ncbi:MAG: hypothetical protein ACLGQX_02710 [Acidobacteriota bacterium]
MNSSLGSPASAAAASLPPASPPPAAREPALLALPEVAPHPNRAAFEGVLTLIETPSDKAPDGARGHRIILSREAVEAALPSLIGMAVNFKDDWSGHNPRQKAGIITAAAIHGRQLRVRGLVYARDFPEIVSRAAGEDANRGGGTLGMSFEMVGGHVRDMRSKIWRLWRLTFVGAAVLDRERAAWRSSSFRILPAAQDAPSPSLSGSLLRRPDDSPRVLHSRSHHPQTAQAQAGSARSVAA